MSWQEYVEQHVGGLTQTEIADRVGVSQSAISRWRKGTQGVDAERAIRFARAVGDRPLAALIAAGFLEPEEARQRPAAAPSLESLTDEQLVEELLNRLRRTRGDGDVQRDAASIDVAFRDHQIEVKNLGNASAFGVVAEVSPIFREAVSNAVDATLGEDAHVPLSGRAVPAAARSTGKLSKGQRRKRTPDAPDDVNQDVLPDDQPS